MIPAISYICPFSLVIALIIVACMLYAYAANARRPANDPKKKDYELRAVFLAPIVLPFLIIFTILFFIFRALLFAMYLGVLTIAMVARKPFILAWVQKLALKIGEPLLKINTELFRLSFRNPDSI